MLYFSIQMDRQKRNRAHELTTEKHKYLKGIFFMNDFSQRIRTDDETGGGIIRRGRSWGRGWSFTFIYVTR